MTQWTPFPLEQSQFLLKQSQSPRTSSLARNTKSAGRLFHTGKDIGFPGISERPLPQLGTKKGPDETIDGAREGLLICEICAK